LNYKELFLRKT